MNGSDEALRANLHRMWTPEMVDRFEQDVRALFNMASPEFLARTTEEEREAVIAVLKQRVIDDLT